MPPSTNQIPTSSEPGTLSSTTTDKENGCGGGFPEGSAAIEPIWMDGLWDPLCAMREGVTFAVLAPRD